MKGMNIISAMRTYDTCVRTYMNSYHTIPYRCPVFTFHVAYSIPYQYKSPNLEFSHPTDRLASPGGHQNGDFDGDWQLGPAADVQVFSSVRPFS